MNRYVKSLYMANLLCCDVGKQFCVWKNFVQHFSPTLLTLLRLFFIVILLLGIAFYQKHLKRVNKLDLLAIIFLGIVGVFINQWSFFIGLQTADPTTSALI